MRMLKCDICGTLFEKGPNCLVLLKGPEFKTWSWLDNNAILKLNNINREADCTVKDVCDDCFKRLNEFIENELPNEREGCDDASI